MGAVHQSCIEYVKKANQHKFTPVLFHNSKCENHMFFNDLISSKMDKTKLSIIPRTNEEYMCVKYGYAKVRSWIV